MRSERELHVEALLEKVERQERAHREQQLAEYRAQVDAAQVRQPCRAYSSGHGLIVRSVLCVVTAGDEGGCRIPHAEGGR